MPSIAFDTAHKYVKISKQASYVQANLFLSNLSKELQIADFELNKLKQAADSSDWLAYLLMIGGTNVRKSERPFALEYEKQIKELYEHLESPYLSKQAYNKVPKTILSVSARYPIENK